MHIATTRTGLSYPQALAELNFGRTVRRADWYTSISRAPDGTIVWNISDALARSCSRSGKNADKTFRPHKTDLAAMDWVVLP